LRHELEQLMDAVARQRQEFDERLGAVHEELDQAREQAAMSTAARDEAEAELAQARQGESSLEKRLMAHGDADRRRVQEASALREQLAAAQVSRDAAIGEAGGLRAELERLGAELTVIREQMTAHGGDLGEAQRLLVDARALTERLRTQSD
jgi:chromosome segregation ATPase